MVILSLPSLLLFTNSIEQHQLVHLNPFQMKRLTRPLFIISIFFLTCTLLVSHAAIHHSSIFATQASAVNGASSFPVVSNETLLSYAAVDLGETDSQRQIKDLLELDSPQGRYRSFSSWHGRLRSWRGRKPFHLTSPKYAGLWPEFQKSLRHWVKRKLFQPEIMHELVSLVKDPVDLHYGLPQEKSKYASCAVVGNSGILLNNTHGTLIDSHAAVIRLNNARTAGFQINVGSKTTISFINSNILYLCARRTGCFCHPYGDTVPIVMYVCQPVHLMDFVLCNRSHHAPLIVTDARFDVFCARIAKYYSLKLFAETTGKSLDEWSSAHDGQMFHYSSGMQAILLAIGMCEKVSIFGFGKSRNAKHHYHTNQKAELHLHDYEAEYAFYKDLIERRKSIPFIDDSRFKIPPVTMYS